MARKFDDNQKNAINSIKNSVVSAGAGSGKTTVLSERFLNLIQNHGASVEQILTLTFTKKATVEMSDRIYKVLKQKSPEQAAKFSKANIKTIDSYCAGIAKLSSRHFGISPDFVQDKNKIHDFAYSLALQTILENRSHSAIKYLISTKNYDDIASQLFMPVLNNSTVISPLDFDSMIEKQLQELISVWNKNSKEIKKEFENASENIVSYEESLTKDMPVTFKKIQDKYQSVGEFFTVELTKEKILSKKLEETENFIMLLSKLAKFPLPGNLKGLEIYKNSVLKFRETYELLVSVYNYAYYFDIVQDYFSLAKDFQQKITDFKRTAGILTFADISDLALKTLIEFPEIRQIEKEKYKFIMIDEFQDNNEMQKSMLFLLAENLSRTEKSVPKAAELCPEKLFFVGDEKQSIYKFRGADVSVFRKLSGEFPDGNLNMSTNYRSHPALISMFNTFFGGFNYPSYPQENKENSSHSIFFSENNPDASSCPDYEAVYKEVTISNSAKEKISKTNLKEIYKPHTHFALYDKQTETDSQHYSKNDCEAEWIAAKIEELLQTQKKTVQKTDSLGNEIEEKVLISPNDIAILLRDTKEQFYYERSLLRHGIPYTSSAATGIFSDGVVNDIFSFLRICVYESDSLSYAQVLSSPFVNLSTKETNSVLFESQKPFSAEGKNLSAESRKRFEKAKEFYFQMKEFSKANPISKTISKLWYESGYYFETLWNQNVTMYNIHYDMILTMALQAEQEQKTLAGFIDDARKYSKDTVKIDDLDIPVEESNGVQIMTVHKSKGLEFEVVFVANTCKGTSNNLSQVYFDSNFGLSINTPIFPKFEAKTKQNYFYKIAKELNEKMQSAELRRVVYVALTRAKTELFITNPKYETPKDFLQANKFLPGQESNPSSFFDVLEPIYNQFASREDENQNELIPFDVEIIEPIPRNAPSKTQKRINNYASKRNLLLYIQKEKLYENVEIYQTEYPEPIYTNPSHLSKDDDEIFSNFKIVENAPYQRINQIVLESVPPQMENTQNESEAEPAFSFANFGTIAHAYLESVISGKKPEEHYSVKEFIGLENKTEKIQEIKKICEEMKNAFENSDLGKRAKNSTKHFAELSFRSKLSSKIVKGVVDLIFEDSDGTFTVVDYKTNQTVVPEIYYAQLKCYKDAVCQIFGKSKNEVKCVLYYLRYAKAVDITEECDKINLKEF